ncbi:MAG: ribonuclease H-like domain-containing protein [Vicinamibacterales bacterium]
MTGGGKAVEPRSLAARIQDILKTAGRQPAAAASRIVLEADEEMAFARRCAEAEARAGAADVLGGRVLDGPYGPTVVIDRVYGCDHRHGCATIAELAGETSRAVAGLDLLAASKASPQPLLSGLGDARLRDLLFFDIETTGLSGGAGTYAFLIGFGRFREDRCFELRQFFLRSYSEERAQLQAVMAFVHECDDEAARSAAAGSEGGAILVTYNGRAFDVPLMETRFLMHRLQCPFDSLRHLDMLPPARRLWRCRESSAAAAARETGEAWRWGRPGIRRPPRDPDELSASCALGVLEHDILGFERYDDVPGHEIPGRYFDYVRSGDARGLEAVVEHNRLDVLSLAAVTAVALRVVDGGAVETRAPHESLALGRFYENAGLFDKATACYRLVAEEARMASASCHPWVRTEGLRRLAFRLHRDHRHSEAAEIWERLLASGVNERFEIEACEALAIFHEHRSRMLGTAHRYATRAFDRQKDASRRAALRHRIDRIERKIQRAAARGAGPGLPEVCPEAQGSS